MTDSRSFAPRSRDWHPPDLSEGYKSSTTRAPNAPLLRLDPTLSETSGPTFGHRDLGSLDHDLLRNYAHGGAPIGERIILHGKVLDGDGRPVPHTLVEIWQANAGGRYRHKNDSYLAPLDPNFGGCGRTLTDGGGGYRFFTIKPGAYPWPNWQPSWRPAHIHVSVFGRSFAERLITQLYFEGDPLIATCPIVNTLSDPQAITRLTAQLDMDEARDFDHLAYRFDIVLRGRGASVFEGHDGAPG